MVLKARLWAHGQVITIEAIDDLLAAAKTIAGEPGWRTDRSRPERALLVAPLAIDGIVGGGLELRAHATIHTEPQRGGATLIYEGGSIQRLNILPDHDHLNPWRPEIPLALRGRRLPAGVSRVYSWRDNRRWPRPRSDNLDVGTLLDVAFADFGEALRGFAARCHIEGYLPPPPWEPRLL